MPRLPRARRRLRTAAGLSAVPLVAVPLLAAVPAAARPAATGNPHAVAVGTGGAVASEDLDASRAGIGILKAGGNAVDAAVATAAALGVTEPFVAGPGGGGYIVVYLKKSHRVVTIDGRETCPATCTPGYFLDRAGNPLPFEKARHSGISVGVPGMVAEWGAAVARYGRLSLARDLAPAVRLARRGFRVDRAFHDTELESIADLRAFTSSRALWLTKSGDALPVGTWLRNPDLAATYAGIARHGTGYLYRGPVGADLVRAVTHPPVWSGTGFTVLPGSLTRRDLAGYRAQVKPPTHVGYRGLDVYGMGPSSSGGITVGEALNILSGWKLGAEPRARALFQYLEASRLAFADRNAYVGDDAYIDVPQAGLLSKAFAATRRCLVHAAALASPAPVGSPYPPYAGCGSATSPAASSSREGGDTNHLVTADAAGNVVSYTNTIEQLAGSGITVPGRGFLLNNELTDFDFSARTPGTFDPNLPAPGKRPRSSMSPTIVLKDGAPWLAVGSPGGATIITTVLQTLVNRIDFGDSLPAAIAAPRASQEDSSTTVAEPAFAHSRIGRALQQRYGERFDVLTGPSYDRVIGFVNAIAFRPGGTFEAATEPVRLGGGAALVVNPTG